MISESDRNRFLSKVSKSGPIPSHVPEIGECWIWIAGSNKNGYGQFWANQRMMRAHRFAWELENGEIPNGLDVLHRCDNRLCTRISHLFLGTDAGNNADRKAKGRNGKLRGVQICNALLNDQAILEIRSNCWKYPIAMLANVYGVKTVTIHAVIQGRTWKHIPMTPDPNALQELERKIERHTMKFRKRAVVIDAVQWLNKKIVCPPGPIWFAEAEEANVIQLAGDTLLIKTLDGTMTAQPGDWIIRGVKNELYPCKPDIFSATYEPVIEPKKSL